MTDLLSSWLRQGKAFPAVIAIVHNPLPIHILLSADFLCDFGSGRNPSAPNGADNWKCGLAMGWRAPGL